MSLKGPLIIVEDDPDDEELMREVLKELNVTNEIIVFINASLALNYLRKNTSAPFLIMSDVNLPGLNGIEFKRQIDYDPELRRRSIPFLFYSTSIEQNVVNEAYMKMTVQGFFLKQQTYEEIRNVVGTIVKYWQYCRHPNSD
jgi:CheY-like chemotaxis protein